MSRQPTSQRFWDRVRAEAFRAPWLDADTERALLSAAQEGDKAAMERLCTCHLRLVVQIAASYQRPWVQVEDLVGEGTVGLVEAIRRFDLTQPTRLSTYAAWWIRSRIRECEYDARTPVSLPATRNVRIARASFAKTQHELTRQLERSPTLAEAARALGVEEADVACVAVAVSARTTPIGDAGAAGGFEPTDAGLDPEEEAANREMQALWRTSVAATLASLGARDRRIVDEHFLQEKVSMADLGSSLGITRQRVSQIMGRLRATLESELRSVAC